MLVARQHAFLRFPHGVLILLAAGACAAETSDAVTEDVSVAIDAEADTFVPELDPITVRVLTTADEGNAPLAVTLTCDVTGESPDRLVYEWDIAGTPSKVPSLDWTFTSVGDKNVCCSAWRPERPDDVAENCKIVRVRNTPALSITEPLIDGPTSVGPTDCLTVSTTVVNKGGRVFDPFDVACALSTKETWDTAESSGQVPLWAGVVESIKDGKAVAQRVDFLQQSMCVPEGTPDGSYFLLCKVDSGDLLAEDDEVDNVRYAASLVNVSGTLGLKPDVTVGSLGLQPGQSFPKNWGENVGFVVDIANNGAGDAATAFAYRVEVCPEGTPPGSAACRLVIQPEQSTIVKLPAGQLITIQRSWTVPTDLPDGRYCFDAAVDVNDTLLESDEDNNTRVDAAACFDVQFSIIPGVDLNVVSVKCSPSEAAWKGTLLAHVVVQNDGTVAAPAWDVEIELTDKPAPNGLWRLCPTGNKSPCLALPGLAPGESRDLDLVVTIPGDIPLKDYSCWVRADSSDKLDELNESNNNKKSAELITVLSKALTDVYVKDISFTPSTQVAGQTVDVTYTLGNQNKSTAAGVTACVVLSADEKFTVADINAKKDIVIGEVIIPEVLPDSKQAPVPVTRTVTLPIELDHTVTSWKLGVLADCKGLLTDDTNKTNNGLVATPADITVTGAEGGCFEDSLESNSVGSPVSIGTGVTGELGLCDSGDSYTVSVARAETLTVDIDVQPIKWIAALGPPAPDLEVRLLDPAGALVDSAKITSGAGSVIAFVVPEDGLYTIEIVPQKAANRAHYALDIRAEPPVAGIDLVGTEVLTTPSTTFPGGALHLDWKLVSAGDTAAGPFTVGLYFSADATFDASEDRRVGTIAFPSAPAANSEKRHDIIVLPTDLLGGTFSVFVQVDDEGQVAEVNEENNVAQGADSVVDAANPCVDDLAFEPNNDKGTATTLPAGSAKYADLGVCPDLEDWYRVDLTVGQTFSAKVTYTYSSKAGNLYVQLLDRKGVALVEGTATTNPTATLPYVWESGAYYVRVYNPKKTSAALPYKYSLDLNVADGAAADACIGDVYEANNAAEYAAPTGCGLRKATLCLKDKDWYTFKLPAAASVSVTLTNKGSDFKMTLFTDPAGNSVSKTTGNGTLAITTPAQKGETYYLLVESKVTTAAATDSFDYELFFDGLTGVDLEVVGVKAASGKAYQGEDEQLSFTMANQCLDAVASAEFGIYLSTDDVFDAGDTLVELQTTGTISPGEGLAVTQKFTVPPSTPPGLYSVFVVADPGELIAESNEDNNASATAFQVQELCVDDAAEPNNTAALAHPVTVGDELALQVCPFDADWYKVDVTWPSRTLAIYADFSLAAGGDLDLRVYDSPSSATPVAKAYQSTEGESLVFVAPTAGTYWLRVNGLSGATNAYTLRLELVECGDAVCSAGEDCVTCAEDCGSTYCDDGNVCTADLCDPDGAAPEGYVCSHPASVGPCDDGVECNGADSCSGGMCVGGSGECPVCPGASLPAAGALSLTPLTTVVGYDVDAKAATCAPTPCDDGLDNALSAYPPAVGELVEAYDAGDLRLVLNVAGNTLTLYRASTGPDGLVLHPDSLDALCAERVVLDAAAPVGTLVTATGASSVALSLHVGTEVIAITWHLPMVTYDSDTNATVIAGAVDWSELVTLLDAVAFEGPDDYPDTFNTSVVPDLDLDGDLTAESVSFSVVFSAAPVAPPVP